MRCTGKCFIFLSKNKPKTVEKNKAHFKSPTLTVTALSYPSLTSISDKKSINGSMYLTGNGPWRCSAVSANASGQKGTVFKQILTCLTRIDFSPGVRNLNCGASICAFQTFHKLPHSVETLRTVNFTGS